MARRGFSSVEKFSTVKRKKKLINVLMSKSEEKMVFFQPSLVRDKVRLASFLKVETVVRDVFEDIPAVSSALGLAFLGGCS